MKWEYRTELCDPWVGFLTGWGWEGKIDAQGLTDRLNELSEEGWELVTASEQYHRRQLPMILRRPVSSE